MMEVQMDETIVVLSETENFSAWQAEEPDGEKTYHLEFGSVTVHFFQEEWDEFLKLVGDVPHAAGG
jgi:hypothetical protein